MELFGHSNPFSLASTLSRQAFLGLGVIGAFESCLVRSRSIDLLQPLSALDGGGFLLSTITGEEGRVLIFAYLNTCLIGLR